MMQRGVAPVLLVSSMAICCRLGYELQGEPTGLTSDAGTRGLVGASGAAGAGNTGASGGADAGSDGVAGSDVTAGTASSSAGEAGSGPLPPCLSDCADLSAGLAGHWKLDGDALDASPFANHGVEVDGPAYVAGQIGQALELDGISQHIDIGQHAEHALSSMTLAVWVTWRGSSSWTALLAHGVDGSNFYGLWETDDKKLDAFHFRWSDAVQMEQVRHDLVTTIDLDTWYHLVGTFDATSRTARSYLDGQLDQETLDCLVPTPTSEVLWLGGKPVNAEFFNGLLDDVRIYDRALTAQEVRALFEMR